MVQNFEKLGVFYLGREYDPERRQPKDDLLLYDSKDLVTHAVCVGMTGSGKTGLCLSLLEEAAIDGIPALIIDPKGDLANLLLAFPELRAQDFEPWVNEDDARRKGLSRAEFAARQADLWKQGLAEWGQDAGRIVRMREAADFAIYTPASDAGLPLSVLSSFAAPPKAVFDDREALRERTTATATALLAMLGIEGDPIRSREHILLATIFDTAWRQGRDLDLAHVIQLIQAPPVSRVGVLELESFYPAKERFELAMALNNLLASPGFNAWMEGEPLDIGSLLRTAAGKPRMSIFSIAHLSDTERMFFVSLLLNQAVSWMRTQSGTSSLRAIVYMDEIFGYFPPVANPPSKQPLLTLLKQARAFGVGVVLATQNPVDLDYKGLANAGTWFVGRLQTERDKGRLLDGLEGAAAGGAFDRARMERILAGLGNRVFLMNNVHEDAPVVFESRWALSYLRGPLTRAEISVLMRPRKQPPEGAAAPVSIPSPPVTGARPVLPPDVPQRFLPARGGGPLLYQPMLVGAAQVRFTETKNRVDVARDCVVLAPAARPWEESEELEIDVAELEGEPAGEAEFAPLEPAAAQSKSYAAWSRDFVNWVYANRKLELFRSPSLGELSQPGESERDFRLRIDQRSREQRDELTARLRERYAPKIAALQERIRRAEQAVARESEQARDQKLQVAVAIGTGLLGAFFGRKLVSASTIGKAGTAARSLGRAHREAQDVDRAEETVEALRAQLQELETRTQAEVDALAARVDPVAEQLETVVLRPKKTNITLRLVSLAWAPYRRKAGGTLEPAWK